MDNYIDIYMAKPGERVKIACERCGDIFKVHPYRKNTAKFCSKSCKSRSVYKDYIPKGKLTYICKICGRGTVAYRSTPLIYCSQSCSHKDEEKRKRAAKKQSEILKNDWATGKRKGGYSLSIQARKNMSASHKKAVKEGRCHFWKGGKTKEATLLRSSLEYKLWRESVFKRDDYTCQQCGSRSGNGKTVVLNADHIKPFAHFPELRFDLNNGRTLCVPCHKQTPTYGRPATKTLVDARNTEYYSNN